MSVQSKSWFQLEFTLDGVEHVEADHRTQRIKVNYDDAWITSREIAAELAEIGYHTQAE